MASQAVDPETEKKEASVLLPAGKELVVYVPVLATAIAVTYDVGYFWGVDINFFTLFSLSDHILFAVEILPAAFIMSSIFIVDVALRGIAYHPLPFVESYMTKMSNVTLMVIILVLTALILSFFVFHFLFVGVVAVIISVVWAEWYRHKPTVIKMGVIGGALVLAVAFCLGVDVARGFLRRPSTAYSVQTTEDVVRGIVLRSGDKGVLFFDPSKRELSLIKWDKIARINVSK
jgi:hypothetical protein